MEKLLHLSERYPACLSTILIYFPSAFYDEGLLIKPLTI